MILVLALNRQFIQFAIIGAVGTAGHYLVLILLVELLDWSPVVATSYGFLVGALINYILNYNFTFCSNAPHHIALSKFLLVALFSALVNTGLVYIFHEKLEIYYLLAQVFTTGIVLLLNFTLQRAWTFR